MPFETFLSWSLADAEASLRAFQQKNIDFAVDGSVVQYLCRVSANEADAIVAALNPAGGVVNGLGLITSVIAVSDAGDAENPPVELWAFAAARERQAREQHEGDGQSADPKRHVPRAERVKTLDESRRARHVLGEAVRS